MALLYVSGVHPLVNGHHHLLLRGDPHLSDSLHLPEKLSPCSAENSRLHLTKGLQGGRHAPKVLLLSGALRHKESSQTPESRNIAKDLPSPPASPHEQIGLQITVGIHLPDYCTKSPRIIEVFNLAKYLPLIERQNMVQDHYPLGGSSESHQGHMKT